MKLFYLALSMLILSDRLLFCFWCFPLKSNVLLSLVPLLHLMNLTFLQEWRCQPSTWRKGLVLVWLQNILRIRQTRVMWNNLARQINILPNASHGTAYPYCLDEGKREVVLRWYQFVGHVVAFSLRWEWVSKSWRTQSLISNKPLE